MRRQQYFLVGRCERSGECICDANDVCVCMNVWILKARHFGTQRDWREDQTEARRPTSQRLLCLTLPLILSLQTARIRRESRAAIAYSLRAVAFLFWRFSLWRKKPLLKLLPRGGTESFQWMDIKLRGLQLLTACEDLRGFNWSPGVQHDPRRRPLRNTSPEGCVALTRERRKGTSHIICNAKRGILRHILLNTRVINWRGFATQFDD